MAGRRRRSGASSATRSAAAKKGWATRRTGGYKGAKRARYTKRLGTTRAQRSATAKSAAAYRKVKIKQALRDKARGGHLAPVVRRHLARTIRENRKRTRAAGYRVSGYKSSGAGLGWSSKGQYRKWRNAGW
jgi:hypothetical protein